MLTRLRVSGFKNLVNIDISFGPFTCIAGANGVGKSNLLDAIVFLSGLADGTLLDAVLSVRDQGAKTGDIRGLFHHVGEHFDEEMSFEAEMIIPQNGTDDLGQPATATATFVRYAIALRYKRDESARTLGSLELIKEDLKHIPLQDVVRHLPFPHSAEWRRRAVRNEHGAPDYISTEGEGAARVIKVHQDGGSSGKPQKLLAASLPRTVLSAANSAESPTATLVKREMQSWRLVQLEPSALREPDSFTAPFELDSDGAHLPATLFHLANASRESDLDSDAVYAEVANRLSELIDDVRSVRVDRDEPRQLLTLYATGRDGTAYPARAMSDGTLRFLALTVLSMDPDARGLICMEEPENGIHPERISAIIELLRDLATNVEEPEPVGAGNSLRQVIINTHSPSVVMQVPDDCLVMAEPVDLNRDRVLFRALQLRCLPDTWRATEMKLETMSKGSLLSYLNPVSLPDVDVPNGRSRVHSRRVMDRKDLRQYKIPFDELSA
jgi:predicted ATPase